MYGVYNNRSLNESVLFGNIAGGKCITKELEYIDMLKLNKISGIDLSSRTENIEKILPDNLPVITFERLISNRISSVSCDNYQGGEIAARHLLESGCKNLLHISAAHNILVPPDVRRDASVKICEENQIPYNFDTIYKMFYSGKIQNL